MALLLWAPIIATSAGHLATGASIYMLSVPYNCLILVMSGIYSYIAILLILDNQKKKKKKEESMRKYNSVGLFPSYFLSIC